ncbi:unnamed protein product [Brassica napus]|uniref:(rape) hypothetical protein n=1 Tax=Brassica napus TaxID=3708 RepID=A0A816TQU1_BRANA|nr:unnamed protein product [Brassica napus]
MKKSSRRWHVTRRRLLLHLVAVRFLEEQSLFIPDSCLVLG